MATATKNLENDHVYILRLIDVMEKMVLNCTTDFEHMQAVVSVIKGYADEYHHAKEENLLFPLLVKKGFSNEQGPVSVMLNDHMEGRNFVKGMIEELANYKKDDLSSLPRIYENMQGYIDLLRAHIGKENNVLFRMADRVLTEIEQQNLLYEFSKIDNIDYGDGKLANYIATIDSLESIYV